VVNSLKIVYQSAQIVFISYLADAQWKAVQKANSRAGKKSKMQKETIMAGTSRAANPKMARVGRRIQITALLGLGLFCGAFDSDASAQAGASASATVHGKVLNAAGDIAAGATVYLQLNGATRVEAVADA
jgi:hypothetical protein